MEESQRWSKAQIIFYAFLVICGLVLRFLFLDQRSIHHDESLHGVYSLYFLENSQTGFYKYDPLLHGPLLYHIVPWFQWIFGITKEAIRLPAAFLGSLLLFVPLLFKRYLSPATAIILLVLIAFSPSLVYWSRFIRHDGFVFLGLFLMIYSALKMKSLLKGPVFGLGLALHFCAKENFYVHFLFLFVILFYEPAIYRAFGVIKESWLSKTLTYIRHNPLSLFLGIVVFFMVSIHYYSAGFIYWQGVIDAFTGESFRYWFNQHHQERIAGPFSYPFLINSFFDTWWIPALLLHLYKFYKRQNWIIQLAFAFSFLFSGLAHFMYENPLSTSFLTHILKLKIPLDFYLFFPLLAHSIILVTTYLIEHRQGKAFSAFFFFASLFTYCYLGEKVPWLAAYPLITGILFFGFEFDKTFHWPILIPLSVLIVHLIHTCLWANFKFASAPENLLSQVHTSKEFESTMTEIRSEMEAHAQGRGPYLLVKKGETWPTTWYFHGRQEYHFIEGLKPLDEYQYVLTKPADQEAQKSLAQSHKHERLVLRHWWLPRYREITFSKIWNYIAFKKPWNETGRQYTELWIKKRVFSLPKESTDNSFVP